MPSDESLVRGSTDHLLDRLDRMSRSHSQSVEWLLDEMFRKRYECRPFQFSTLIEQPSIVPPQSWDRLLADLVKAGHLTLAEARQAVSSDLVLCGGDPVASSYLIVEVSGTVTEQDVRRAAERAAILGRVGLHVQGAVAGQSIHRSALALSELLGIGRVLERELDGEDPTGGEDDKP